MLEDLKERVCEANLALKRHGLVVLTWGNASGIDRSLDEPLIVIKPSGISYDEMTPEDMVVVDMDGKVVEGRYKPSSDTPTHIRLYQAFPMIGGVTHTHSAYATVFSQAGRGIPAYGTTHADYFHGEIHCSRTLNNAEINGDYEAETGNLIAETLGSTEPLSVPGVLVKHHGPFTWGLTPEEAVIHAVVLEEVARMALMTIELNPKICPMPQGLMEKHYSRKHGANAYYGQN